MALSARVTVVTSSDRHIEELLKELGIEHVTVSESKLEAIAGRSEEPDGILVVDVRDRSHLPPALVALKRQHPAAMVVIVTTTIEPGLMLEAMRAGVNECVSEPLTAKDMATAVSRLSERLRTTPGAIYAFVGARGGVGTTTVAVNVATELAQMEDDGTILIDLHAAFGDAALFIGAEPRFSVVDAVENAKKLDEALLRSLVARRKGRPDVLSSPNRTSLALLDTSGIKAVVEFATRVYKHVVLDMTLYDPAAPEVLSLATRIAVVTNQELTAVRNAARIVGDLRSQFGKDRVNTIINRADKSADIGVEDVERAVGQTVKHILPSDYREAIKALNAGVPLTLGDSKRLSEGFRRLAQDLAGIALAPAHATERQRGSVFGRLTGRHVTALGVIK